MSTYYEIRGWDEHRVPKETELEEWDL